MKLTNVLMSQTCAYFLGVETMLELRLLASFLFSEEVQGYALPY